MEDKAELLLLGRKALKEDVQRKIKNKSKNIFKKKLQKRILNLQKKNLLQIKAKKKFEEVSC